MPQFTKVATTDELADQQAKLVEVQGPEDCPVSCGQGLLCPERHLHPSKGAVVRRDGRGNRGDMSLARGEVRHQDRGRPGAARWAGGQELPGEGHRRQH